MVSHAQREDLLADRDDDVAIAEDGGGDGFGGARRPAGVGHAGPHLDPAQLVFRRISLIGPFRGRTLRGSQDARRPAVEAHDVQQLWHVHVLGR